MKKKALALVLACTLAGAMLTGCSSNSQTSETSRTQATATTATEAPAASEQTAATDNSGMVDINGMTVGYCIPDTSESFLANLSNSVKEKFAADGVTVDIANAAGDSATQINQIENYITAKVLLAAVGFDNYQKSARLTKEDKKQLKAA